MITGGGGDQGQQRLILKLALGTLALRVANSILHNALTVN